MLNCVERDAPHNLGLRLHFGGTGITVARVARIALDHAFAGEREEREATIALAESLLDRAEHDEPKATTAEAEALIEALGSAYEYMADNHYADDEDFPEDAMVARVLESTQLIVCFTNH
jgi:hypothetical protein